MALDGVAGEVLYPSQGLFYFKVTDPDSVRLDNAIEIDYPFMDNPPDAEWIKTLPLCAEDREKLLNGNARRLLKL
jgi:hypothetical protein